MLEIKVSNKEAMAALASLKINKSAIHGAIQRTLDKSRRELERRVTERYVRPDLAMAGLKIKVNGLKGEMTSRGHRHSLTKFLVTPSTRPPHNPSGGLNIKVRRGDNEQLPHAFIGRGQAFERTGQSRLPINRLTGPANAQMVGSKHIAPAIEQLTAHLLRKEIEGLLS